LVTRGASQPVAADLPAVTRLDVADSASLRRVERLVRERQGRWRLLC
jgi:hypothetical protein